MNTGAHGRQTVVGVHDHVHERVQHAQEECLTTGNVFDTGPCVDHHAEVVKHVQKRDLVLFLSQRENDRIDEVHYFDDEIEPHGRAHSEGLRVVRVVDRLANHAVLALNGHREYFVTNVKRDGDLENVVDEDEGFELEGLPVGHDDLDGQDAHKVADEYESRVDRVVHQRPIGDSWIADAHVVVVQLGSLIHVVVAKGSLCGSNRWEGQKWNPIESG